MSTRLTTGVGSKTAYRTRANKGRANYSKNIFQTLDAAIYQERPLIKKYFLS